MPSSQKALMDAATKRADKMRAKSAAVDFKELLRLEPDSGTTNIRNTSSSHWRRWLGRNNRCLVPFSSFSGQALKCWNVIAPEHRKRDRWRRFVPRINLSLRKIPAP
jgi:hypothetical protein